MSVCLTFESWWDYPGTEFRGAVSKLGKKIEIRSCVFTFSVKLEKWSFRVADFPRTGKKCIEIKTAREGRAKLLFLNMKCVKFVALSLQTRRRSETPYVCQKSERARYEQVRAFDTNE